jgi:hypothetical protein
MSKCSLPVLRDCLGAACRALRCSGVGGAIRAPHHRFPALRNTRRRSGFHYRPSNSLHSLQAFTTGQASQRAPPKTTGLPLAGPDQVVCVFVVEGVYVHIHKAQEDLRAQPPRAGGGDLCFLSR